MSEPAELEIAAADRLLHVLAVMARAPRALTASELVAVSGLSRSALYRQLSRLKKYGLLQEHAGRYAPGPLCMQLAMGFERDTNLVRVARPVLEQLSLSSNESVGLVVASHDHAICLAMVESPQSLRCSFVPGRSVPLQRGASALCLLAHLPAPQRDALLTLHYGENTPQRIAAQTELQHIREAGYVVTMGEVDPGVWGCSAPLLVAGRRAVGAITLMAPQMRLQGQEAGWVQQTLSAAARIVRALKD